MTSEARANPVSRGASMVLEQEQAVNQLGQILRGLSPRTFFVPLVIIAFIGVLMTPKGWLVSAIDHEIEQFQVHGELKNLDALTIEKKLATWLGSSFLTADLEEIKTDVESLAWVHKATVTRVWPGKLVLNLTEQTPVAYWNESAFLNQEGEVFAPDMVEKNQPLPLLVGPEQSQQLLRAEMLAEMSQLKSLLAPYMLDAQSLEVSERGSWAMTLGDGIRVALGSRPFESKVERLAAVLSDAPKQQRERMESIDTRYPNGVAVKWKDVTVASNSSK